MVYIPITYIQIKCKYNIIHVPIIGIGALPLLPLNYANGVHN
jgi:hypothetical protein